MRITFDRTIPTVLSDEQLWRLLVLSFRNSDESPIWPHDLETIRSASVESGALVRAVYKGPGGMQSHVTYRLADVEPGRRLRYVAEPSHPLRGGGAVEILPAPAGCVLHWYGAYDVPWRPAALAAAAFTRLYFAWRFFAVLEEKLREWEAEGEYHNK
jgi:hypothetical protein